MPNHEFRGSCAPNSTHPITRYPVYLLQTLQVMLSSPGITLVYYKVLRTCVMQKAFRGREVLRGQAPRTALAF